MAVKAGQPFIPNREEPTYAPSTTPLKTAAELAAMYGGITYDENAIKSKFDAATKGQYDMLRKEYETTENKFYGQMYGAQNTALDTIRRANASAVATGASRGIQAAQELSAILGLQDTASETATQLAADRNLLMDKEAAAYTQNAVNALTTSNQTKQALGTLGANLYASDTQFNVGEMQYYAALNQAAQALSGTKYVADQNLTGTKYASDANLTGVKYNADSNFKSAEASANATKEAARISAAATVSAATIANKAQTAYYESLKNPANAEKNAVDLMKDMQAEYEKFQKAHDYENAALWLMKFAPNMDYNKALSIVKDKAATQASLWGYSQTIVKSAVPWMPDLPYYP